MKKVTIAFDIDGTLRSNKDGYEHGNPIGAMPNERIRSMLINFSKFKNIECHIWSGGGKQYAMDIRRMFLLTQYVKEQNCHGKFDNDGFRPDIAIDDIQDCELGIFNLIVREK